MRGNLVVASWCLRKEREAREGDLKEMEPAELGLRISRSIRKLRVDGVSLNFVRSKTGGFGGVRIGGRMSAKMMTRMVTNKMGRKKRRQHERRREEVVMEGLR